MLQSVLLLLHLLHNQVSSTYDNLSMAHECWRASRYNLPNEEILSKPHIFKQAVSNEFCDYILDQALDHAAKNGWDIIQKHLHNISHYRYVSKLRKVHTLPIASLNDSIIELAQGIVSNFTKFYDVPEELLSLQKAVVVQYRLKDEEYRHHRTFVKHRDGSDYTFILSLNGENEFKGGGTKFFTSNQSYSTNKGDLILFPGKLLHGGIRVTSGERYILVGHYTIGDLMCENLLSIDITITNHLDQEINLFWVQISTTDRHLVATIEANGGWVTIRAEEHDEYFCNEDLCRFMVEDMRKKYYDIM